MHMKWLMKDQVLSTQSGILMGLKKRYLETIRDNKLFGKAGSQTTASQFDYV